MTQNRVATHPLGPNRVLETIIAAEGTPASAKPEAMYWCSDAHARWTKADASGGSASSKAESIWKKLIWSYPDSNWAKYARARLAEPSGDRDPNQSDGSSGKVTASFRDMPVAEAVKMLSSLTGKPIRIEGGLSTQPLVTLSLRYVDAEQAIEYIGRVAGLRVSVKDGVFILTPQ